MWARGVRGLFSSDLACDVRDAYREMIEDGVDDDEALSRVLSGFAEVVDDPDHGPELWVALAVTQSEIGRLDNDVAATAIGVIDRGEGLDLWAEDPKLLMRRKVALAKARAQLVGPQPDRIRLRAPKRRLSNLTPGDLFVYRSGGVCTVTRVKAIDSDRRGDWPVMILVDWLDSVPPAMGTRLFDRLRIPSGRASGYRDVPWGSVEFQCVEPNIDDGQVLADLGFERIGKLRIEQDADPSKFRSYGHWSALATTLSRHIRDTPAKS